LRQKLYTNYRVKITQCYCENGDRRPRAGLTWTVGCRIGLHRGAGRRRAKGPQMVCCASRPQVRKVGFCASNGKDVGLESYSAYLRRSASPKRANWPWPMAASWRMESILDRRRGLESHKDSSVVSGQR